MTDLLTCCSYGKTERGILSILKLRSWVKRKKCVWSVVGALLGYGAGGEEGRRKGAEAGILEASEESYGITEEDILDIAEAIPKGSAGWYSYFEQLWAKSLKQALRDAGVLVAQGMLTPELIIAVGEELAEAVKFAEEKEPASSA